MSKKFVFFISLTQLLYFGFYLVKHDDRTSILIVALLLCLLVVYTKVASLVVLQKVSLKWIIALMAVLSVSLSFIRPVASDDLYTYIYRGRLMAKYQVNPYLVPYDTYSND